MKYRIVKETRINEEDDFGFVIEWKFWILPWFTYIWHYPEYSAEARYDTLEDAKKDLETITKDFEREKRVKREVMFETR